MTGLLTGLLDGLQNKRYHIYFNNFYTSPDLCNRLLTLGFGSCGTVRIDRKGIPKSFRHANPKKGEIVTYRNGKILGLKSMNPWCQSSDTLTRQQEGQRT